MPQKKPLVSVLLASYNHSPWIGEAIVSVLNQTFSDLELIIVDDGSEDNSAEIIKKYAIKDSRIRYEIFNNNQGAIIATKAAFKLASGEYIAIINSDDVWKLEKLEKQVKFLDINPDIGAVFALPKFIDANSNEIITKKTGFEDSSKNKSRHQWLNYFFKNGNCLCHPSILIRKECYNNVGFYNPAMRSLPDFDMWVRLCFKYDIHVMNENLVKFRKHSFNESGINISNIIRSETEYRQILKNFITNTKSMSELKAIFPEYLHLFKVEDKLLIPFYIAFIALERNSSFSTDFALDVLYSEMKNYKILNIIQENDLYSLKKLWKDVVEKNIYKLSFKKKILFKIPFLEVIRETELKQNLKRRVFKIRLFGMKLSFGT